MTGYYGGGTTSADLPASYAKALADSAASTRIEILSPTKETCSKSGLPMAFQQPSKYRWPGALCYELGAGLPAPKRHRCLAQRAGTGRAHTGGHLRDRANGRGKYAGQKPPPMSSRYNDRTTAEFAISMVLADRQAGGVAAGAMTQPGASPCKVCLTVCARSSPPPPMKNWQL